MKTLTRSRPRARCLPAALLAALVLVGCPSVTAVSSSGTAAFERDLATTPHTLVVFTTAWCEVCAAESPALVAWARAHRDQTRVVVVISGSPPAAAHKVATQRQLDGPDVEGVVEVVVDESGALADHYMIASTPTLIGFAAAAVSGTWHSIADVPAP